MPSQERRTDSQPDRHFVTALARGLDVLACFRTGDQLLANGEIAERCQLPKSTVSRLTYTLTRLGHLIHDEEQGKYRLGLATFALGSAMQAQLDVREVATPLMQQLADFARVEVSLGSRDRLSMVYLVHCRSTELRDRRLRVGSRLPLAATSIGHAWLAGCPEADREAALTRLRARHGQAWPALAQRLEQSMQVFAQDGVTLVMGGWQPSVHAIARPLRLGGGWPTLAISCGGPAFALSHDYLMRTLRPRLIELTVRIEAAMLRRPLGARLGRTGR